MDQLVAQLPSMVNELIGEFVSHPVAGDLSTFGISQYTFWMFVCIAILCVLLFAFVKAQSKSLVPHGFFVNGVEFVVEYFRDNVLLHICRRQEPRCMGLHQEPCSQGRSLPREPCRVGHRGLLHDP